MSAASTGLLAAVEKLEAETQRVRSEGLDDLRRLLTFSRNDSNLLGDEGFHSIFEALYRLVRIDKAAFLKATKTISKNTTTSSRLSAAASALRLVVEAAGTRIRFKTITSVLDHIIGTLPTADDSICEPLKVDYLKSFRILLENPSYREHLRPKQWQTFVDFILECVSSVNASESNDIDSILGQDASFSSLRTSNYLSIRTSQVANPRPSNSAKDTVLEELMQALKALTSVTNAPVSSRSLVIVEMAIEYISTATRALETALETINNTAITLLTCDIAFVHRLLATLIPVLRRLWLGKSQAIRDQILVTLTLGRIFFVAAPGSSYSLAPLLREQLLSTLLTEYNGRTTRPPRLHIDEIVIRQTTTPNGGETTTFLPLRDSAQAISNWYTLLTMAYLVSGLSVATHKDDNDEDHPRKRYKSHNAISDLINTARGADVKEKVTALQVLFFIYELPTGLPSLITEEVPTLLTLLSDDDSHVASWTMLLYSRYVNTEAVHDKESGMFWQQVWDAARRMINVPGTARAACRLLHSIVSTNVLSTEWRIYSLQESIFPSGTTGPSYISDTSLLLFTHLLQSCQATTDLELESFVLKIVAWLRVSWTLPSVSDKTHNVQTAFHIQPDVLLPLIFALRGLPFINQSISVKSATHPVSRAEATISRSMAFLSYFCTVPSPKSQGQTRTIEVSGKPMDRPSRINIEQAILDAFSSKVREFQVSWKLVSAERASGINLDVLAIVSTLCTCVHGAQAVPFINSTASAALCNLTKDLWNLMIVHVETNVSDMFATMLSVVASRLQQLRDSSFPTNHAIAQSTHDLTCSLLPLLKRSLEPEYLDSVVGDEDMNDSLDTRKSQGSVVDPSRVQTLVFRHYLDDDLVYCNTAVFQWLDFTIRSQVADGNGNMDTATVADVVAHIVQLEPVHILMAQDVILHFLRVSSRLSRSDANKLLERLAEVCLQDNDYERCESALCCCLNIMTALAPLWTTVDVDDDLSATALDVYSWYLDTALGKGIASPQVLLKLATLLDAIIQINVTFADDTLPSPRTSILRILQVIEPAFKYQLSSPLSRLFDRFVLSEHTAIFNDILDNLPSDADNAEGIAARFHIVAELGYRWHTIRRHATFTLFETAAYVPRLTLLAKTCVDQLTKQLGLGTPRHLFTSYAAQILYTWLATGNLDDIPYAAFSYDSLENFLQDNKIELAAQISLRGAKEKASRMTALLGSAWETILDEAFPRAEAYCLASEISLPQAERLSVGSESQLRKLFGTEKYVRNIQETFPSILAALLISLEDDSGIEKALERSQYADGLRAFQSVCKRSKSSLPLPAAQQPSFRAKFLLDEIQYLCSRINLEAGVVWDPALLVYIYRSLLDIVLPHLGPLHACMVLRKIRIVMCLGGQSATSGYPLEMLLHNLRPHLTNFHCSEDAVGLYWYLLENGKEYLSRRPSFLAGISVVIFVSLTDFVDSPQDSTTQESHFKSTMSQAQAFRAWLGTFLTKLELVDVGEDAAQTFKNLVLSAHVIGSTVTSSRHSSEGTLLLNLLQDSVSTSPLLTESYFELVIKLLSKKFKRVHDLQDDILADGRQTQHLLPVLQKLVRRRSLNDEFRIWLGAAIGRGIAANGFCISTTLYQEQEQSPTPRKDLTSSSSYAAILRTMIDMLWKDDNTTAACAERTLQIIVSKLNSSEFSSITDAEDDARLLNELKFKVLAYPTANERHGAKKLVADLNASTHTLISETWVARLVNELCSQRRADPILGALHALVDTSAECAAAILPYVVHLTLVAELDKKPTVRTRVTEAFSSTLRPSDYLDESRLQLVIETILYLRRCQLPDETNVSQRNLWLDIDFAEAAMAAASIKSWLAALLFLEIQQSQSSLQTSRSSRRSNSNHDPLSRKLLCEVFQSVDDQDFFYGVHEDIDMSSVLLRLTHEDAGTKTVSFQSALLDASLRSHLSNSEIATTAAATAEALNAANLHGISQAVRSLTASATRYDHGKQVLSTPSNLGQWHINKTNTLQIGPAKVFEDLKILANIVDRTMLDTPIGAAIMYCINGVCSPPSTREHQETYQLHLAGLAEMQRILSCRGPQDINSLFDQMIEADDWMKIESFNKVTPYLVYREKIFEHIRTNDNLRSLLSINSPEALLLEARGLRQSLSLSQHHEATQFSLNKATYLSRLSDVAKSHGVNFEAAALYDLATTFWAHNEFSASIRILQAIRDREGLEDQDIQISRSEVLTNLGQKVAEARLEKPDEIITNYLVPAYKELKHQTTGSKAGLVFHNFAAFCDMQLQDNDNHDDFTRIAKIRERKLVEVRDLEKMIRGSEGKQREQLKMHYAKAKTWFKLDDEEWQRVQANRETLILRCLENYLLSMIACDDFPNDTLRLLSLWLDRAHSPKANASVHKYIGSVPTRKFAPLMNQLSSRILNTKDDFQQLLMDLVFRICCDHPYHSLYQIFATSKSKGAQNDEVAASRFAAANKLAELIRSKGTSASVWISVHNTSIAFVKVAQERIADKALKTGSKVLLKQLPNGGKLISTLEGSATKIPPPTMKIAARADKDYSTIPVMVEFDPQISIAGGVSAPKIATAIASDGSRHKMLLKGGNDDLRQDSIMEQVFKQVSDLLQDHRATRQRELGIRTYKVVPLYPNAGIIEFVQNTIPLHDYLLPAHTRYYPKDYKPNRCRKDISDAQTKPLQQRIQAYRTVTSNFHPVMRFFFMDRFFDPEEWFQKRLNYSRSTAAISILGHVLGLGDRHGHNILLDTTSGEVVHIDLGVAFEAGRVLPVPEVVPFRLTRDLVDGMGISGVEGVFRRCCNFTLEALRHEQEAIMTILDVLRYDPLYSWSVSPLRLQKMQENMEQAAAAAAAAAASTNSSTNIKAETAIANVRSSSRRESSGPNKDAATPTAAGASGQEGHHHNATTEEAAMLLNQVKKDLGEPNEADRALTVVAKKLSKSLSVEATVNELIRQATDERNLAVLYCGWAAYA